MAARKPRKPQAVDILATRIYRWVSAYNLQSDPYLSGLAQAIEEKKDLHIFAEMDPMEYLPHPDANVGLASARLVRILTVIRNVLVFAPVALTWAAVSAATTGFSQYIKENGTDVVNFLDFWQNGYDILGEEWKIGNVARLDFVIVLIVIVLTLYVSQAGHKVRTLQRSTENAIDRERTALAIEIRTALDDKKKITNVTMNASLAGSVSRLVAASQKLESASREIDKAARKLPRA
ncbi:unannotated protein [freshwater metagenome]|jgi:hypothetical protein|uniref:Unannotated protein n=1 Tax=freshwater metagenome TaxID=449393 RepID=A0A6J7EVW8_9ZZZZ|nr:hypothetical protein [Actinomycetota bacterium]